MLQKITLLLIVLFAITVPGTAQNSWTLERCIEYAQQNNLSTKQAQYNIQSAELSQNLFQYSRLPNVSGRVSGGYQFGRTIDPTTNTFNNERIGFNTFAMDASMTLYGGGQINNSVAQSKINTRAARLEAESILNNTSLNIAAAYLNILLNEEQLANARKSLELSQEQLEQTDKLIRAGALPPNDRLDFIAQIARNEQMIIEAQNGLAIGYLNLKQLMEVDPAEPIKVVRPVGIDQFIASDPAAFKVEEIYTAALQTQPQIKAGDLRLESSQLSEDIARAGYLPTLTLFGSLNTNYSSIAQNAIFGTRLIDQVIILDGNPIDVQFENQVPIDFERVDYANQIRENFGQTVGLQLSVPIYSNHRNKIETERAQIGVLTQQVTNQQQRQQLKTDVQRAIADARASKESLKAAQGTVDAVQNAFDNAQKRFTLGAINSLEYTTARNNLDRAQVDLISAKYQYVFNLKTVDFYLGRKITLE